MHLKLIPHFLNELPRGELRGIKKCHSGLSGIFLCYTAGPYKEHCSEGFPTSGNDRIADTFTPIQSLEELFE